MTEPNGILSLFAFPEFVFRICSKSSQVLHSCLEMCTTTRAATLGLEQQLIKVYPNWGLSFVIPNSRYYGLFETSIDYVIINKELLPPVDAKAPEWKRFGNLPEKPSELHDSPIGQIFRDLRYAVRVHVPEFLDVQRRPKKHSEEIHTWPFLTSMMRNNGIVDYYHSSCGSIYARIGGNFERAILVARNFQQFIAEFAKCLVLRDDEISSQHAPLRDRKFLEQLINNLPRCPSWKYDFCSNCGGGRCTHLAQDHGCWACKNCKFALCSSCCQQQLLGLIATHAHPLYRVHAEEGQATPTLSHFCEGCNCYLWRSPGHALLCQHRDRAFCLECLANREQDPTDPCVFNVECAISTVLCDACSSKIHLYDTVFSCECKPLSTFDVCKECGPIGKAKHEATAAGPHKWTESIAFYEDCHRCDCSLKLNEVNWVCTRCFHDQWFCSDCSREGCPSCKQPLTPYQNGRICENP